MHLDREVVILRMRLGDCGGGFAHAKTDLEYFGRSSAECLVQVQRCVAVGDAIDRH